MTRFFVPAILTLAVSGLAFTLIAIVIARSPYVHANLRPAGYDRTEIVRVGEELPFEGLGLTNPQFAQTGAPVQDGAALFLSYGRVTCHGLDGRGGVIGPDLREAARSAPRVLGAVRGGPRSMPTFDPSLLTDEDPEKIIAFLRSQ